SASLQGPGLNPWDRGRWSGGSSSGSASAVGAGLVPFALGSETSGSIGTPSAYCGVTGLRPTYGLVSRHGAMALSWTLDKFGPMVQTVYASEGASIFAELIEGPRFEELVDARQKAGLRASLEIKARDYLRAMRLRTTLIEAYAAIFTNVDVILTMGRAATATRVTQPLDLPPTAGGAVAQPTKRPGNTGMIAAGNLAGLPAIFFPCGFATDGLPVGLQLVGPPFSEALLVALASAYQRETDHHVRRPKDGLEGS